MERRVSGRAMRWMLHHALGAMMPGSDTLPSADDAGLGEFVPRFLHEADWLMWVGAVGASAMFVASPPLTVRRPLPSFLLSQQRLDQHAHNMSVHDAYMVRQCAFLLKMIVGMHWGAHEAVRAEWDLPPYGPDPADWRMG